ncbi:MAG: divergent PAP2 family protein [Acholeplasmatales bacterium]|nr:divergent PAP2 family protein [Acholeplasmatales bacterium]
MELAISRATGPKVVCIVISSLLAMLVAQIWKVIYHSVKQKRFAWRYFFTTGGMPSSHSSTMVSMVTTLAILQLRYEGGVGYEFAIAVAFTIVVIYDAMGIRYQAGKHADMLNKLLKTEPENVREEVGFDENNELKVSLGHKPLEVAIGITLGVIVGILCGIMYILIINV